MSSDFNIDIVVTLQYIILGICFKSRCYNYDTSSCREHKIQSKYVVLNPSRRHSELTFEVLKYD